MQDPQLNIAMTVSCTHSEGPGKRYALWVQGCPLRCRGCCNPEMLEITPKHRLPVSQLVDDILTTKNIEGVTFLGGEPLLQASALAVLAKTLRQHGLSIMLFTGYTYHHIRKTANPDWNALLAQTDLLVSGPYDARQRSMKRAWIGSDNQEVHYLSDRYKSLKDDPQRWRSIPNSVDIVYRNGQLTVNGFPTDALETLRTQLSKRG